MDTTVLVPLIMSAGSIIVAIIGGVFGYIDNRRIDTLEEEVEQLKKENCSFNRRLKSLRAYARQLLSGIERLISQLIRNGLEPDWRPCDPPEEMYKE